MAGGYLTAVCGPENLECAARCWPTRLTSTVISYATRPASTSPPASTARHAPGPGEKQQRVVHLEEVRAAPPAAKAAAGSAGQALHPGGEGGQVVRVVGRQ